MAAAAFSRTRGSASARGLFLIFSLLCLDSVASSLYAHGQLMLERMKNSIKETERWKAEDKYRKETITKLFDLSSSLNDKEQLKLFKETLHKAIKEEQRLKVNYMYRIATSGFDEIYEKSTRQLEMMKRSSPDCPIANISSHMLKTARTCIDKKMSLLQN